MSRKSNKLRVLRMYNVKKVRKEICKNIVSRNSNVKKVEKVKNAFVFFFTKVH